MATAAANLDALITSQEAKLIAPDLAANDSLGISVALSGNTALLGAVADDQGTGSAYVFVRSNAVWRFQSKLTASDRIFADSFGRSVALEDDTALVGADGDDVATGRNQGSVYVFARTGTTWTQQAKLIALTATNDYRAGYAVAISGNTALVGTRILPTTVPGRAYVFVRNGTAWSQQAVLMPEVSIPGDGFGRSVALVNDVAIVGARNDDSAYVFTRTGSVWIQQARLSSPRAEGGSQFGASVALSGNIALVGASWDDNEVGTDIGSVYVFARSGATWSETAVLTARDAVPYDRFGDQIAFVGDTAVVGCPLHVAQPSGGLGVAYIFKNAGTNWTQVAELSANDESGIDQFGWDVALSDDTVLVGAPQASPNNATTAGAGYVFRLTNAVPDIAVEFPPGTEITNHTGRIDFGTVRVGAAAAPKAFRILNVGSYPLTLTALTKSGTDAADFSINGPVLPAIIATNSHASFTVGFHPAAGGARNVLLRISSDDPDEGSFEFLLEGNGNTAPLLLIPSNIVAEATGPAGAAIQFVASAADAEDGPLIPIATPASGSLFPLGTNWVVVVATDAGGWSVTNSFQVIVRDTTPPTIVSCPAQRDLTVSSECQVTLPNLARELLADDIVGIAAITQIPAEGTALAPGAFVVSFIVADAAGNERQCETTVRVRDNTPPQITCRSNLVLECAGPEGAVGHFDVTATDNCGFARVICTPPSGSVFPNGVTLVRCTATDSAANEKSCSFPVTVADTTSPRLTCPGDPGVTVECFMPAVFPVAAMDDCDGAVPAQCVPPSGAVFPPGQTLVTCNTKDNAGNSASCRFVLTVLDTRPPSIRCPEAITVSVTGRNDSVVNWDIGGSDDCSEVTRVCEPPSGSRFTLGQTLIRCAVADASSNLTSCSFFVSVKRLNLCPMPIAFATATCPTNGPTSTEPIVSGNNANACVTLDGRRSFDLDGDALLFLWVEEASQLPLSTNAITTNCLTVGGHDIRLLVGDRRCDAETFVHVEVIRPCEALEELVMRIDTSSLQRRAKRPLIASLKTACASLDRSQFDAAQGQLNAFQNKLRAQSEYAPTALADEWQRYVQRILDALNGCH